MYSPLQRKGRASCAANEKSEPQNPSGAGARFARVSKERKGRASVILLILPLAACNLGSSKQAATPPPPKPAAVQPPTPEPQLSIPQTAVVLPSPQPVNPDAIPAPPAAQVQSPPAEAPPPAHTARRTTTANPPKPEPEAEPETPAAPSAPAVQQQAPIQPILSGPEQKQLQDAIEGRRREIEEQINRASRHLTSHDRSLIERINSFLAQCAQAEKRGEYTQADALSQRAAILARELQGE
jgi:hypothetical protein